MIDPPTAAEYAVDPADEARHPVGSEQLWNESWYFDFAADDGSLGGYVRIGLYPNLGVAWYWAAVVRPGSPCVLVVDHEVALPPSSLEIRGEGLWADHTCEEPTQRWSLGLEAFGVALDDPADAYHGARGERVPVGVDLEWETVGAPFRYPAVLDRYEIPCRVHGELQLGHAAIAVDAVGQRDHSWGPRDWWGPPWCWTGLHLDDGTHSHSVSIVPDVGFGIGYLQRGPAGEVFDLPLGIVAGPVLGREGLAERVDLQMGEVAFELEPLAWAPILLTAPDGRLTRLPRALVAVREGGTRRGVGWLELGQTPSLAPSVE